MFDNGLLRYYPQFSTKSGLLKTNKLGYAVKPVLGESVDTIYKISNGKSDFYVKSESKSSIDSQVLISQALLKYGVGAPVYLPAKTISGNYATISTDIQSDQCVQGINLRDRLKQSNVFLQRDKIVVSPDFPIDYSSIFTREGMRQLLKLNLFASPAFLDDLTPENVFYNFNEQGKVCGVSVIDFSESCSISSSTRSRYFSGHKEVDFINNIGSPCDKTRSQMVAELTHNKIVQCYLPTSEQVELVGTMAEEIRSIASDIKSTTGYEVSQAYVDKVSASLSDFASELSVSQV